MTYYMRWRPGTVAEYQYFEVARARWVDCERAMIGHFLKRGTLHMNPAVDPVVLFGRLR